MPTIAEYTDYRKFLRDCYAQAKRRNHGFSYRIFADKAGLTSRGFLFNVLAGKRNLSRSNVLGIISALNLDKPEALYFEYLVAFNQAKSLKERNHYFSRLAAIKSRGKTAWKPQQIRNDQYEFYANLRHSVVRSLIGIHGFSGDYDQLARRVQARITPGQARESVALLESLGLIKRRKDGSYTLSAASVATPPEVQSLAVQNFHQQAGEQALRSLNELSGRVRNMTAVTLGISKQGYRRICDEITDFRAKLLRMAEADTDPECVYQLNFQFFPVSRPDDERISP